MDQKYDKIMVQPKSEDEKEGFAVRKFVVTGEQVITVNNLLVTLSSLHCLLVCMSLLTQAVVPINVTLFHFTEWPNNEKATNTKGLLNLIKELLIVQQNTGNRAITVMCKLVYIHSAVYCVTVVLGLSLLIVKHHAHTE